MTLDELGPGSVYDALVTELLIDPDAVGREISAGIADLARITSAAPLPTPVPAQEPSTQVLTVLPAPPVRLALPAASS